MVWLQRAAPPHPTRTAARAAATLVLAFSTHAVAAAQAVTDGTSRLEAGRSLAGWVTAAWRALGPLHPAAVHLPIGLLIFAALIIPLRRFARSIPSDVVYWPLLIASLASVAACAMGWSFAPQQGYSASPFDLSSDRTLLLHRWGAVLLTAWLLAVSVYATLARCRPESRKAQAIWQCGVLVAAAAVGLVGHWGGNLVYGEDMLARAWSHLQPLMSEPPAHPPTQGPKPPAPKPPVEPAVTATPIIPAPAPPEPRVPPHKPEAALTHDPNAPAPSLINAVDFRAQVAPILEASCLSCHGPTKKKSGLAMHTHELLLKGGSGGPALTPGRPAESELIRLTATEDPELLMPPVDHGGPLKPEQINILRRWIEQGAPWPQGLTLQPVKP